MEEQNRPVLSDDFQKAGSPRQTLCSVPIDDDLLAWMKAAGCDVTREINGLLRFYMDTSVSMEPEGRSAAWTPADMDMPPPDAPAL
jgi:hypothetical protein